MIMDAVWRPIANAVMSPVFGALIDDLDNVRNLDGLEGESYVDKDLRTLLGDPVVGPLQPLVLRRSARCRLCSDSLWQAIHQTADALAAQQGQADPSLWRKTAAAHQASCRDFCRTRSRPPTARRSSRCSSSTDWDPSSAAS